MIGIGTPSSKSNIERIVILRRWHQAVPTSQSHQSQIGPRL